MAWFLSFLLGLLFAVVSYLLTPRPKQPPPPAVQDGDDPVAENGKPIPVIFGTLTIKELEVLWFGDKRHDEFDIDV